VGDRSDRRSEADGVAEARAKPDGRFLEAAHKPILLRAPLRVDERLPTPAGPNIAEYATAVAALEEAAAGIPLDRPWAASRAGSLDAVTVDSWLNEQLQLGGRTYSVEEASATVDLGGQWIGPGQDHVYALAAEMGVPTFPQWTAGDDVALEHGQPRRVRSEEDYDPDDLGRGHAPCWATTVANLFSAEPSNLSLLHLLFYVTRSRASSTTVEHPSSVSFRAAAKPAYPPPTTAASRTSLMGRRTLQASARNP
jgi:hypothetical protein